MLKRYAARVLRSASIRLLRMSDALDGRRTGVLLGGIITGDVRATEEDAIVSGVTIART